MSVDDERELERLRDENERLREELNWYQVEAVARTNTRWETRRGIET